MINMQLHYCAALKRNSLSYHTDNALSPEGPLCQPSGLEAARCCFYTICLVPRARPRNQEPASTGGP